jgi:hypothetical protein
VRFDIVLDCFSIELSWSLGVVGWGCIHSRVVLGDFGVVGWDSILGGVVLGRFGDATRGSVICRVTLGVLVV